MTEAEWLTCTNPQEMLGLFGGPGQRTEAEFSLLSWSTVGSRSWTGAIRYGLVGHCPQPQARRWAHCDRPEQCGWTRSRPGCSFCG